MEASTAQLRLISMDNDPSRVSAVVLDSSVCGRHTLGRESLLGPDRNEEPRVGFGTWVEKRSNPRREG